MDADRAPITELLKGTLSDLLGCPLRRSHAGAGGRRADLPPAMLPGLRRGGHRPPGLGDEVQLRALLPGAPGPHTGREPRRAPTTAAGCLDASCPRSVPPETGVNLDETQHAGSGSLTAPSDSGTIAAPEQGFCPRRGSRIWPWRRPALTENWPYVTYDLGGRHAVRATVALAALTASRRPRHCRHRAQRRDSGGLERNDGELERCLTVQ